MPSRYSALDRLRGRAHDEDMQAKTLAERQAAAQEQTRQENSRRVPGWAEEERGYARERLLYRQGQDPVVRVPGE